MIAAFLIGFLGSVHCAGMCGPLMITFTKGSKNPVFSFLTYHTGRLLTYSVIGLLFGTLSGSLAFFHFQQTGAIILGALIILIYAFPQSRNKLEKLYYQSRFYQWVKKAMTSFYPGNARWLASGMLNGLVPCGLIYLAAAGSVLAGGFFDAILFMLAFGVGTIPALAGVAIMNKRLPQVFKRLSNLTTPVALVSGALLIFRGLTVSSPDLNSLLTSQINNLISVCGF